MCRYKAISENFPTKLILNERLKLSLIRYGTSNWSMTMSEYKKKVWEPNCGRIVSSTYYSVYFVINFLSRRTRETEETAYRDCRVLTVAHVHSQSASANPPTRHDEEEQPKIIKPELESTVRTPPRNNQSLALLNSSLRFSSPSGLVRSVKQISQPAVQSQSKTPGPRCGAFTTLFLIGKLLRRSNPRNLLYTAMKSRSLIRGIARLYIAPTAERKLFSSIPKFTPRSPPFNVPKPSPPPPPSAVLQQLRTFSSLLLRAKVAFYPLWFGNLYHRFWPA
jgi:hypothetical protein